MDKEQEINFTLNLLKVVDAYEQDETVCKDGECNPVTKNRCLAKEGFNDALHELHYKFGEYLRLLGYKEVIEYPNCEKMGKLRNKFYPEDNTHKIRKNNTHNHE